MIDPVALIQLALTAGSQWLANNPRTPYETFSDPAPQSTQSTAAATDSGSVGASSVSAQAATYDSNGCVVTYTYSPEGEPILLSVTLPDPLVPEYDYCLAHMNGETFNG